MSSPLALHLAERFAADARRLRARAAALTAARRGTGPDATSCTRMAEACDRVERLFAEAADEIPDDDALRDLMPQIEDLVAGARSPDERNVYAGAVVRLTEGLNGENDDANDEDDA